MSLIVSENMRHKCAECVVCGWTIRPPLTAPKEGMSYKTCACSDRNTCVGHSWGSDSPIVRPTDQELQAEADAYNAERQAEYQKALDLNKALVAMLRRIEWGTTGLCPCCRGKKPWKGDDDQILDGNPWGHLPSCTLDAILKRSELKKGL
jgi:hypothetical protein